MKGHLLLLTVLVFQLLPSVTPISQLRQPKTNKRIHCNYYINNVKSYTKSASCANVKYVPSLTATGRVTQLNLDDNRIKNFYDDSFTSWKDIEMLSADINEISSIAPKAFKPLTKLTKLILRNNKLVIGKGLNSSIFHFIPRLEYLDLSENPLGSIPKDFFKSLKYLRVLILNKALGGLKLKDHAFEGLSRLHTLDLSDDSLTTLSEAGMKKSFSNMDLKNLYLGGNRWLCDCHMRWFKKWIFKRDEQKKRIEFTKYTRAKNSFRRALKVEPICYLPYRLYDRSLSAYETQIEDYQCHPVIRSKPQNQSVCRGTKNVTFTCHVYSDPIGVVRWYRNDNMVFPWVDGHTNQSPLRRNNAPNATSRLTIRNVTEVDAGVWKCVARNSAGESSVDFTLHIIPKFECIQMGLNNFFNSLQQYIKGHYVFNNTKT